MKEALDMWAQKGAERKKPACPGAHEDTEGPWLTSVRSEYMIINASADEYNIKLCINYRRDSIPKPLCWNVSQRTPLEQHVTHQRINLLHICISYKVKSTPAEHGRVI